MAAKYPTIAFWLYLLFFAVAIRFYLLGHQAIAFLIILSAFLILSVWAWLRGVE